MNPRCKHARRRAAKEAARLARRSPGYEKRQARAREWGLYHLAVRLGLKVRRPA